jgi:hypothetical protein
MIEMLFEIVFEVVIDVFLGIILEVLSEAGIYAYERSRENWVLRPVVGVAGYFLLGIIVGWASAEFFPGHLRIAESARLAGRIISPFLLGLTLCLVSWVISRRDVGEPFFNWGKFVSGFVFSGSYTLTRYWALEG